MVAQPEGHFVYYIACVVGGPMYFQKLGRVQAYRKGVWREAAKEIVCSDEIPWCVSILRKSATGLEST